MKFDGSVIIHSGNPVGADRMCNLLIDHDVFAVKFPFGTFDVKIEEV